jgi:hypothetical protein
MIFHSVSPLFLPCLSLSLPVSFTLDPIIHAFISLPLDPNEVDVKKTKVYAWHFHLDCISYPASSTMPWFLQRPYQLHRTGKTPSQCQSHSQSYSRSSTTAVVLARNASCNILDWTRNPDHSVNAVPRPDPSRTHLTHAAQPQPPPSFLVPQNGSSHRSFVPSLSHQSESCRTPKKKPSFGSEILGPDLDR